MLVLGVSYPQLGNNRKINFTSKSQTAKDAVQVVFNPKTKSSSRRLLEKFFGPIREPRLDIPQSGVIENLTLSPKTLLRYEYGAFFGKSCTFNGICISPKADFSRNALATEKSRFIGNSFTLSDSAVLAGNVKGKTFYSTISRKHKPSYQKKSQQFVYDFLEKLDDRVSKKNGLVNDVKPVIKYNTTDSHMTLLDTSRIAKTADISGIKNFRATDFAVIEGKVSSENAVLVGCSTLSETGVINCKNLKIHPDAVIKGHIYTESCSPVILAKYPENIHIMPKYWFDLMPPLQKQRA